MGREKGEMELKTVKKMAIDRYMEGEKQGKREEDSVGKQTRE